MKRICSQVHRGRGHQRLQVRVGREDGGGRVHELAAGAQQGHQGERGKNIHYFLCWELTVLEEFWAEK